MQQKVSVIAAVLIATTLLGGCSTVEQMDQPTYERLHKEAKATFDKSDAVNYAWSTAEDAFEKADEAARASDWATAIKEVKKAREHSKLAYKQYQAERSKGPVFD